MSINFRNHQNQDVPNLNLGHSKSLTKLEKDFLLAVQGLNQIKKQLEGDQWLVAYSLYKQATEGDCNKKRPSRVFKKRFLKYQYWSRRQGMPTDVAAKRYIAIVKQYMENVNMKMNNVKSRALRFKRNSKESPRRRKLNKAEATVEVNTFLTTTAFSTSGAVFSEENPIETYLSTIDDGNSTFTQEKKIRIFPTHKRGLRSKFVPSEVEFQKVGSFEAKEEESSFLRPIFKYRGPNLLSLVRQSKAEKSELKGKSVLLSNSSIDGGYKDLLPVIYMLKCDFLKGIQVDIGKVLSDSPEVITDIPLDKYMFRLVRYLDKWFEEMPSLNSTGALALIMSYIYIEARLKQEIDLEVDENSTYKLLAIFMFVAAKYLNKKPVALAYWSQVTGIPIGGLTQGEKFFLEAIDFKLEVSIKEFSAFANKYKLTISEIPQIYSSISKEEERDSISV